MIVVHVTLDSNVVFHIAMLQYGNSPRMLSNHMKKTFLVIILSFITCSAQAGWLDDIKTAVGGHLSDIKSRFMDDQVIEGNVIASAIFREDDRGQDMLHHGSGSVTLVQTSEGRYVQLAPDFFSTPGPDYHVYVSNDTNIDHEDRFIKAHQQELGKLIKGSGASYYKLPENTEFKSVTIWCKAFNEFIMSADFETLKPLEQAKYHF